MKLADFLASTEMTDSAFAAAVGVHHTTVGRWKHGDTRPDWQQIERILEVTQGAVTPNDFVTIAAASPKDAAA